MKAAAVVLGGLLLAGCAGPSSDRVGATTPSARISVSPSLAASPARLESPSPGQIPPSTVVVSSLGRSLSCRLPVVWYAGGTRAGFITFPGGVLQQDPSAPAGALFYDPAYQRWLPVLRDSVSPDGARYAYDSGDFMSHTGGKVHVVDLATGADKILYVDPAGVVYKIVGFTSAGIYLTQGDFEARSYGLWFLGLGGGVPRLINSNIASPALGGGFGWGLDFNAADPSPAPGGLQRTMNRLLRIDLASGTATPWLYRPGADLNMVGSDSTGDPLVGVSVPTDASGGYSNEIWLVASGSTAATRLLVASNNAPSPTMVSAVDRYGTWLDGSNGEVWLYASGSMQIAATDAGSGLHVAGGCIP